MAIIRCPSCGKPNPDFLDVCQFCDLPLHPDAPAKPAAPRPAADETLIGGGTQTVRCQACGRANPSHLEVCQYCQARLKPMVAGGPAATTPAADDTQAPAGNLMNRLRSMGASAPLTPADEPEPEPEEPVEPSPANWMSRLRGMTDDAPAPTGLDTAAASNEPDWMWTGGAAEAETPAAAEEPAAYAPPPTEVTPGSEELPDWLRDPNAPTLPGAGASDAKPRRKMTDWLNARPGNAPVEPPAVNDVPDWLKNLAGGTSTLPVSGPLPADSPAARAAGPPPPAGTSDLPDWLKNIRTSTPLGGSEAEPNPHASSAHRMQALPEWMRTGTIAGPEPLPDPDEEPADYTPPSDSPSDLAPAATEAEPVDTAGGEAGSEDLPAWLRAIITPGAADETIPVPNKPKKKKKMTDWLGNQPPPPTDAPSVDAELPDWLKALSAGESAPPPAPPPSSAVAEGLPAWLKPADALEPETPPAEASAPAARPSSAVAEGLPAWLKPADTREPEAPAALPPPAAPMTTDPAGYAPALAADNDLPDWLRSLSPSADALADAGATMAPPSQPTPSAASFTPAPPPPAAEPPLITPTSTAADLPDWLTALAPAAAGAGSDAPDLDNDTLAWLNTLSSEPSAGAPSAEVPMPSAMAAALKPAEAENPLDLGSMPLPAEAPAWLDELAAASKTPPAAPLSASTSAAGPEIQPTPETELPEWLKTMRGLPGENDPPPEEMPDWLRAMRGLPPLAREERQLRAAETAAFQQELAAAAPPTPEPSEAEATMVSGGPALPADATAAGALPAWLSAMRPVDIAQATAGEGDDYEERLGVLAGMRGVLRAEPAVAQLHRAAPAVNRLAVSAMHTEHAKLLTGLQQSEAAATPRKRNVARVAQYVERWVVFAVLAAAIILAQFQLPGLFAPPTGGQRSATDAYNAIMAAGAQSGAAGALLRPALVAFDYDAAQQGELNPAAIAILRQLLGAGVPVVGVATRATGAAVGQGLLQAAADELQADTGFSYTYGTQYLNLGFIPGGPIGLLQFASVPRSAFQNDFSDQYGGDAWVWDAPAVADIETLSDFSLIVLIAGSPAATRGWVEQAQLNAPDVPMIAVVSAAAEPLARPFLESVPPQLDGLVVGLGGAAVLEQQLGRPGTAAAAWPALGGGLLAAVVIITMGNLIFGLLALVRRRR